MEKRFDNGLVLGKFMPPHLGHLFLIDSAAEQCNEVHVMICSIKSEPIHGELRYHWLNNIYSEHSNIHIIHCTDENPQVPEEDENFWAIWHKSVYSRIEKLDAVFTSEDYGDMFAQELDNIEHVSVDQERSTYQVSGTDVRTNALQKWIFIPETVKPHYVKKIAVLGPESTGKSTLTRMLAAYFDTNYVEEYARTYIEGLKDNHRLTVEDFNNIALKHKDNVQQGTETANKFLVCDTEAITTQIFGRMYIDEKFTSPIIEDIIEDQHFDLWLLLDVDVPWVDDGTRVFPQNRRDHFYRIQEELLKRGINYHVINGDYESRLNDAITQIQSLKL